MPRERIYTAAEAKRMFAKKARNKARGPRQKGQRQMNGLEMLYVHEYLEPQRMTGHIGAWKYEAITLKLADDCRYTPDFHFWALDGVLEFHETKGHWREDARIKIKMAAELFPNCRFVACQRIKGQWARERFYPPAGAQVQRSDAGRRA